MITTLKGLLKIPKRLLLTIRERYFLGNSIACAIIVVLCVVSNASIAQMLVGATLHCESGECDANTSDQGGDNHSVDLAEHRAEARAQGGLNQGDQNGLNQDAFAEVGIRFESCISAPRVVKKLMRLQSSSPVPRKYARVAVERLPLV